MLPISLTTNEVKDAAGAEIEFSRLSTEGRKLVYAKVAETPSAPHRITVQHTEVGSGAAMRRRSVCRVDKTIVGTSGENRTVSAYVVCDLPVGDIATSAEPVAVLANLISFLANTGADTTVDYDCTGTGAAALIAGSL